MVLGGNQHRRNAYKHAFSMLAILTQLATLASWTMDLWLRDKPRISLTLYQCGAYLWYITLAFGHFTGHCQNLVQAKTFFFAWSSYAIVCKFIPSLIRWLNNRGDPNLHRELTIWAFNVSMQGLSVCIYLWNFMRTRPL
ncbi:hypothetical protein EV363DRAFT_1325513 [Boletus edulis]|nr:hypothetical protein EV363DRAFT_1325513 [Boletus edulis]